MRGPVKPLGVSASRPRRPPQPFRWQSPDGSHDVRLERFYQPGMIANQHNLPAGPIKACSLHGIKDSPPFFHDGRLLTLEDTVEFFNLVLDLKLTQEEKYGLVAFMRCL